MPYPGQGGIPIGLVKLLGCLETVVCETYWTKPRDLQEITRKANIVEARQMCHFITHRYYGLQLSLTSDRFGRKDHTTVSHSCVHIKNMIETDKRTREKFTEIMKFIGASGKEIEECLL